MKIAELKTFVVGNPPPGFGGGPTAPHLVKTGAARGEPVRHFCRAPPEVYDTSGAGDTALAALGTALAVGAPLDLAIEFALLAAGVVVEKAGTATASQARRL